MELIWHILLTVCLGSTCIEQDVQQFNTKADCDKMLVLYSEIPADGDWDTVEYICKPTHQSLNQKPLTIIYNHVILNFKIKR